MQLGYVLKAETKIGSKIPWGNSVPEQSEIQFLITFAAKITLFGRAVLTLVQIKNVLRSR